jgi:hypothetical protein
MDSPLSAPLKSRSNRSLGEQCLQTRRDDVDTDDWDRLCTSLVTMIDDLDVAPRFSLLVRILRAECLADLWELRMPVRDAIALQRSEDLAQAKLEQFDALWI